MKIILKIVLLSLILLVSVDAHSQYRTRAERRLTADFRVGLNFSDMDIDNGNEFKEIKTGFHIAVLVQYKMIKGFQIQSGIVVTKKGLKQDQYTFTRDTEEMLEYIIDKQTSVDFNYMQVPLYLGYEHFFTENLALNINAGPYAAYGFKGKKKIDGTKYKTTGFGDILEDYNTGQQQTFKKNGFEKWDYGVGGAIGLVYDIYSFGVGYEYSFAPLRDKEFYPNNKSLKHRNTYVSVGFRF